LAVRILAFAPDDGEQRRLSLDIYIQHDRLGVDKESKELPAPGGSLCMTMRRAGMPLACAASTTSTMGCSPAQV
jgi:hypothetical protein